MAIEWNPFRKIIVLLFIIIVYTFNSKAQTSPTSYLQLDKAISTALENNQAIRIAYIDEKIAKSKYQQTDAVYLPQIDLGYTAMMTNNPLNAFGFNLQQATITANNFNPDLLNNPSATKDFSAKAEIRQPIFNLDMIYARKGAEKQIDLYRYKTERTKEHIIYEVKKAYMQLQLSYRAESVLSESLNKIKEIYSLVNNFYDQGLIQKSDVLTAQVHVATLESAVSKATSNIKNASDGLHFLIGDQSDIIFEVDNQIKDNNQKQIQSSLIPSSRADFTAMEKAIESAQMMIKSSKMSYLPRINAFGSYQFNDAKLMGFGADSYLLGVSLTWNIFSGNKTKSTMNTYKFQKNQLQETLSMQKKQSLVELNRVQRELIDGHLDVTKQEIIVEQAAEALRILENRYSEGLVSTTDLLAAQTLLSQHRLTLQQSIFNNNITFAYLEFITSSDKK